MGIRHHRQQAYENFLKLVMPAPLGIFILIYMRRESIVRESVLADTCTILCNNIHIKPAQITSTARLRCDNHYIGLIRSGKYLQLHRGNALITASETSLKCWSISDEECATEVVGLWSRQKINSRHFGWVAYSLTADMPCNIISLIQITKEQRNWLRIDTTTPIRRLIRDPIRRTLCGISTRRRALFRARKTIYSTVCRFTRSEYCHKPYFSKIFIKLM